MPQFHNTVQLYTIIPFIGIFAFFISPIAVNDQLALAQQNASLQVPVSNTTGLPESGLQLLLLTESGGLAGLDRVYTYNIVTKELASIDLRTNSVEKKSLNSSEIQNLTDAFYSMPISDVFDRSPCPDCIQYGLSWFFIDLEKLVPIMEASFWTDTTPGADGNMEFARLIENISSK